MLGTRDIVEAQMTLSVPSFLWNFVQDIKVVPNKFLVWVSVHFVKETVLHLVVKDPEYLPKLTPFTLQ